MAITEIYLVGKNAFDFYFIHFYQTHIHPHFFFPIYIPDPLLEDPWDLAEAFEDSFASLSQPMASTNLPSHFTAMELDMQQRKAGAKKMKKEAGDEQQGGSSGGNVESEGDHDGGCSQKTIVDEVRLIDLTLTLYHFPSLLCL